MLFRPLLRFLKPTEGVKVTGLAAEAHGKHKGGCVVAQQSVVVVSQCDKERRTCSQGSVSARLLVWGELQCVTAVAGMPGGARAGGTHCLP